VIKMLLAGLLIGAFAAAHAKLPAVAPKSEAEKAAEAKKAAGAKAKDAQLLIRAQERAAANYRKNSGADHSRPISPRHEPTPKEEATAMPLPGQANDHSTPARRSR
jgi:hypothetical protein